LDAAAGVVSKLLMIEQRPGPSASQPWILDRNGRRMPGHNHDRRLSQLRAGLVSHTRVSSALADSSDEELEQTLHKLHEPSYLQALGEVCSNKPIMMPRLTAPGMAPDTPVWAGVTAAAFEGVRTAIAAANRIVAGARFSYALCRPPGHHAGPAWLGGCCYLNNAAAAAQTLCDGGLRPVGILDVDIHYPNGTSAIAAGMTDTRLHSLHAWPVVNVPSLTAHPCTEHERIVEFSEPPTEAAYLDVLASSVETLSRSASALVLSLGYDTVRGDPHGSWGFSPQIFTQIGRILAASHSPVCVVQEGGYSLEVLAQCSQAFATGLLDQGAG
jgi:acetoin utilization deacetylase AcuC-like enzyme